MAAAAFKSNDRMPPRTGANLHRMMTEIRTWDSPHRDEALRFAEEVTPRALFDILHGMRRWYSGQTMARKLLEHRSALSTVMKLDPADAVGVYRGFKVDKHDPLAQAEVGRRIRLRVSRNRGFSSWSTTPGPTNRFSGASKAKVGLLVRLVGSQNVTPVLAPPEHTKEWFNALYAKLIGKSFRPKEGEYLIAAPSVEAEVVRVKTWGRR